MYNIGLVIWATFDYNMESTVFSNIVFYFFIIDVWINLYVPRGRLFHKYLLFLLTHKYVIRLEVIITYHSFYLH